MKVFKVGNRVKLLENTYHHMENERDCFAPGKLGTVYAFTPNTVEVIMDWDIEGFEYCFYPNEVEVI